MRKVVWWIAFAYFTGQLIGISGCVSYFRKIPHYTPPTWQVRGDVTRIQWGSCNESSDPQPFWPVLADRNPDAFIWLGDIVYPDPLLPGPVMNLNRLEHLYAVQKTLPDYAAFRAKIPVIGIYDDHDYGWDNGGKYYPYKEQSKQLLLDFLDEPQHSPRRRQAGAYASYTLGSPPHQVKILLLDTRFNREDPGPTADILGEHQWQWLQRELAQSTAQVHLIGSSISILSEDHHTENWSHFPQSRKRLFTMLQALSPEGLVIVSGDKHYGELRHLSLAGQSIYEMISSGLTHYNDTPRYKKKAPLQAYSGLNAGELTVNWKEQYMTLALLNGKGQAVISQSIPLTAPLVAE